VETGVEKIVAMDRGGVPIIVVFTKYDNLVNSAILEVMDDETLELDDEQVWSFGEEKANETFESLCVTTVAKTVGKVPVTKVSTQERYKDTIAKLIDVTDTAVQQHMHDGFHIKPTSLVWAMAQRGNADTNIKASIAVGRKKYWSGLLASTDFTGQKLQRCLDIIHGDIVAVWNIHDSDNYLAGNNFKARISGLVADLHANPRVSISSSGDALSLTTVTAFASAAVSPLSIAIASVGSAVLFAKWVYDVYQHTPGNISCIMAYVVDLTIVMHRLFTVDVSEDHVVSVLESYAKSGEIARVHHDIREFVSSSGLCHLGEDNVLNEIIRLIEKHRVESK